ncbi:MAG: flagellar biosynthesis anti-sigma factor FlgM [Oligoflexia bacterium]|nr:flagellar biosynthesis anti-sigma factor FlgM [Oligoflexia bacterium]
MKVPPGDSSDAVKKLLRNDSNNDAVKIMRDTKPPGSRAAALPGEDSVEVTKVGRYLSSELQPEKIEAASRANIERLKELIGSGNYRPSADEIAAKLAGHIDDEVAIGKLEGIPKDED